MFRAFNSRLWKKLRDHPIYLESLDIVAYQNRLGAIKDKSGAFPQK